MVNTWVENPYWQFFCGETYLQTEQPIDPSSLTCWRQRIGEEGVETLLAATRRAKCGAKAASICAQGNRLASTASGWRRSIISASGWRKKSALSGWASAKLPEIKS